VPNGSKQEFLTKILNTTEPIVLDAWAEWCGPCKAIAPKIEEFSTIYPAAKFYKVDVDKVPDVAQELGIRAMPTFMFFKEGEKITEVVGANPHAIEEGIKALLA
jgi:thioredoxin 1